MDLICTVPTPHLLGPATWAQRLSAFLVYILRNLSKSAGFVSLAGEALSFLYLMLPYFYDRSMFIYRFVRFSWKKGVLEREHGGRDVISCLLPCVLYCMEGD